MGVKSSHSLTAVRQQQPIVSHRARFLGIILAIVTPAAALDCGEKLDPVPARGVCKTTAAVTYKGQIRGILDAYCVSCHTPSDRVVLTTFTAAKQNAELSNGSIQAETMPPSGDSPLSETDKCLFQAWVDQGANEG